MEPTFTATPRRSASSALLAAAAVGILLVVLLGSAIFGPSSNPVMVTGLSAPRGLTPTEEGGLLIAEVGAGRLLEMSPDGEVSVIADGLPFSPVSGPGQYPAGPSAVVKRNSHYYTVIGEHFVPGFSEMYRLEPGDDPEPVTGQEIVNRFGTNPLTNPYDLVPTSDGGFLVSDSGINAILYISEDGEISEYVTFPRRENPEPLNGFSEIDVVPTGMDRGPDGAVYVASLTGFPYPTGAALVYRLEDADSTSGGTFTVYADGFTTATDVVVDVDGSLLVTEFSSDLASLERDQDIRDAAQLPGRLVRWMDGEITVVAEGLVSPTSVAVVDDRIFVSEEYAGRVSEVVDGSASSPRTEPWLLFLAIFSVAFTILGMVWWRRRASQK
jgi:hypothetical protein